MRKIKEMLRLKYTCGLTNRQIAKSFGVSRGSVANYWDRARVAGLTWETVSVLTDTELEATLFAEKPPPAVRVPGRAGAEHPSKRPLPDFEQIHTEVREHKHVTLTLLWEEYKQQSPDGVQFSWFADLYQRWKHTRDFVMRQDHKAGEKLFLDYCDGLVISDPTTGAAIPTQLFLAVWGASNYTYAEASLSQDLPSWTAAHVRAFEYFDCVPHIGVPDNLKSAVTKACRYEPETNPTYHDLACHYGMAVIPARPYHPRDKAKVEVGVLVAQRWILAALRHRRFTSLAEVNAAIWDLLERLNTRLLKKLKTSRRDLFLAIDQPNALPLPEQPFEYAVWKKARVNLDYHIEVDTHYYSVPYRLIHQSVDVRMTASVVEVLHRGHRVACHVRSHNTHRHTTLSEHMPPAHRAHAEMTPSRLVAWAAKTGPHTAALVEAVLASRQHPEQGYRSALGILRLERHYGAGRLENAAARARAFRAVSYQTLKNILANGLDLQSAPKVASALPPHENIRGGEYYEPQIGGTHVD